MWRVLGNLLAAILFSILATLAFAPIVLWIRQGEGFTQQNLQGLLAVAAIIFLTILFTPKTKGAFRRGARVTAFALLSIPIPLGIWGWQGIAETARHGSTKDVVADVWILGLPLLVLILLAIILGLLMLLFSRKRHPKPDQSS